MGILVLAARFALAAVFAVAGLAKLRDVGGSRKSLGEFGIPAAFTPALAVLLPLAELACAIALLRDRWAIPGAIGAMTLLGVFSVGITVNLARGRTANCHCFGQLSSSPVSWRTLVRNVALLGLAIVVAWEADKTPSVWPALSADALETGMLAALGALTLALAFTLWFLFETMQQNGRLMVRLETVEKKLNIDPKAPPVPGLPLGDPAPPFELKEVDGAARSLETLGKAGQPILLVFTEPGCRACEKLQPELALWQREFTGRVSIVPVSSGDEGMNRTQSAAQAYKITVRPSAVLISGGKIASRTAEGPDAIRALVAQATLPPPVKKGDAAPSIKLPDLTGKTTDLATVRGSRTLLLFWSPSCGYCQKMLPNVKTWKGLDGAPDLVVISSGSLEDNRAQGFSARVLLDPYFGCGQTFGATGTPSAVLLDEEGRVASEVAVGETAVLALAGIGVPAGL